MKKKKFETFNINEPDYNDNLVFLKDDKKPVNKTIKDFEYYFDHCIWYIILIVFILAIAYVNGNSEKQIKLNGTLNCSEILNK